MKKVLVIDDDPDISEAVTLILTDNGFDANFTTKGDKTFQTIHEYNPDVIILDLLLSGNDGRTICKALKANTTTSQIPVIMISAHPAAKKVIEECGADSFIAKPFSVEQILAEVKKFTQNA